MLLFALLFQSLSSNFLWLVVEDSFLVIFSHLFNLKIISYPLHFNWQRFEGRNTILGRKDKIGGKLIISLVLSQLKIKIPIWSWNSFFLILYISTNKTKKQKQHDIIFFVVSYFNYKKRETWENVLVNQTLMILGKTSF